MVKNLPAVQEMWVRFLGQEDPLEKKIATHSRILAWRIQWIEEPGGLQSMGSQRVGHDWATKQQNIYIKWVRKLFPGILASGSDNNFRTPMILSVEAFDTLYKCVLYEVVSLPESLGSNSRSLRQIFYLSLPNIYTWKHKIHKLWKIKHNVQLSSSDHKVNFSCLREQRNLNQRVILNFTLSQWLLAVICWVK